MNKKIYIKLLLSFCALMMVFGSKSFSQTDNHFIYIQAKNKQPFYVILNKKVYSSSTIGYLIIPKLKNGSYTLKIGYPKQSAPETEFNCNVNDADVGYSLQTDDNGQTGLLDLQSQKFIASSGSNDVDNNANIAVNNVANAVQNSAQDNAAKVAASTPKPANSSAFGDMLSSVANDSTLKQKPVVAQPKQDAINQVTETTIPAAANTDFGKDPQKDAQAVIATNSEKHLKPATADVGDQTYGVIKSSENASSDGQQMTFVLFNSRSTDTVQIVIPGSQTSSDNIQTSQNADASQSNPGATPKYGDKSLALFKNSNGDTIPTDDGNGTADSPKTSKKRKKNKNEELPIKTDSSADVSGTVSNPFYEKSNTTAATDNAADVNNNSITTVNSDSDTPPCDNPVSNSDIEKTEKKMLRKGNDDDMLAIADKSIKGKCITTQQVKGLGRLFLSDAGRFAFYQDAYSSVSDKANYSSLQNQLLDTYFKKKFTDMLNQ